MSTDGRKSATRSPWRVPVALCFLLFPLVVAVVVCVLVQRSGGNGWVGALFAIIVVYALSVAGMGVAAFAGRRGRA